MHYYKEQAEAGQGGGEDGRVQGGQHRLRGGEEEACSLRMPHLEGELLEEGGSTLWGNNQRGIPRPPRDRVPAHGQIGTSILFKKMCDWRR